MASSLSSDHGPTRVASGSRPSLSLFLLVGKEGIRATSTGGRRGEKMARSGKGVGGSSNVPVFTASQNNRVKENVNATREWDSQTVL